MIRDVALAAGISAAVALGAFGTHLSAAAPVASAVVAQAPPQPATRPETSAQAPARPQATPGLGDQRQIEGRIGSVGPSAQNITFEDGTMLVLPESLAIRRSELKPGAVIRVQYEERDGQKVITTITLQPPSLVR
jgi:hypothetical protein